MTEGQRRERMQLQGPAGRSLENNKHPDKEGEAGMKGETTESMDS